MTLTCNDVQAFIEVVVVIELILFLSKRKFFNLMSVVKTSGKGPDRSFC